MGLPGQLGLGTYGSHCPAYSERVSHLPDRLGALRSPPGIYAGGIRPSAGQSSVFHNPFGVAGLESAHDADHADLIHYRYKLYVSVNDRLYLLAGTAYDRRFLKGVIGRERFLGILDRCYRRSGDRRHPL